MLESVEPAAAADLHALRMAYLTQEAAGLAAEMGFECCECSRTDDLDTRTPCVRSATLTMAEDTKRWGMSRSICGRAMTTRILVVLPAPSVLFNPPKRDSSELTHLVTVMLRGGRRVG